MDLGISTRAALVTGGSSGIGRATAIALSRAGCAVAVCGRDVAALDETIAALDGACLRRAAFQVDAGNAAAVTAVVERVEAAFGALDILVHCIGGDGAVGDVLGLSDEAWLHDIDLNLMTAVRFDRAAVPRMQLRGFGRVVHVASVAAVRSSPMYAPYCAAKAALVAHSRALSVSCARHGVACNVVLPGVVDTRQMARVEAEVATAEAISAEEVRRRFEVAVPIGRYAEPAEIAGVIAFMCSAGAGYMSGSVVAVDGGMIGKP